MYHKAIAGLGAKGDKMHSCYRGMFIFSAWDSFGSQPIARAFGEWSVATFRDYLKDHSSSGDLISMGIENVDSFDVRIYLINKYREWTGDGVRGWHGCNINIGLCLSGS